MIINFSVFSETKNKRKKLTEEARDFILKRIEIHDENYSTIAQCLNVSVSTISRVAKSGGKERKIRTPLDKGLVYDMVNKGYSASEIAKKTGYPINTVYSTASNLGVSFVFQRRLAS